MPKRYSTELTERAHGLLLEACKLTGRNQKRVTEDAIEMYLKAQMPVCICDPSSESFGPHHLWACAKYQAPL